MRGKSASVVSIIAIIATMAIASFSAFGESVHEEQHRRSDPRDNGRKQTDERRGNPLIEEMIRLDEVFRDVVSGVAMDDGRRVHEALERMHGAMEKTHEGVRRGTVTLGKNADRLEEFVAQDKQFHDRLEHLARAAHGNDGTAMLSLTKELLDRCIRCHRDFRRR